MRQQLPTQGKEGVGHLPNWPSWTIRPHYGRETGGHHYNDHAL